MGRGNSRNSPGELNSNFVCFWSILPDHHMLANGRYLRIPAEDRSRHANRAFGFATADVGVGERTLPT
jgi:hypothetical protein